MCEFFQLLCEPEQNSRADTFFSSDAEVGNLSIDACPLEVRERGRVIIAIDE